MGRRKKADPKPNWPDRENERPRSTDLEAESKTDIEKLAKKYEKGDKDLSLGGKYI